MSVHTATDAQTLHRHPFYPTDASIPDYRPQEIPMSTILSIFFGVLGGILLVSTMIISSKPKTSVSTTLIFLWFVSCGFIHGVVEGYYAFYTRDIASRSGFFADLWKEYAKSDSRYMTVDPFVSIMEAMTATFWSPLSFVAAYMIYTDNPARHLLQFLISTGQLYGDIAYYLTTAMEGFSHSRPESLYFWFYFATLNAPWIFIPIGIMLNSGSIIVKSLQDTEPRKSIKKKEL